MPVINTHQNIAAFLDMLAVSEGTANHPLTKNRGYDVIVTGLDGKPEIFTDYSDHPFAHGRPAKVFNRRGEKSTASGRYQQLYLFWPHYRKQLALPDFSPLSQDRLAIQLIRERGALDDIRAGRIERASLDRANSVASGQQTTITMLKNQLHVAITRADKNELAQVALRQELENAAKREAQREKTITRLLNENEDFRRWYGADLPDAVRRLHQRPACTDASDCPQRLPESESLPDAGQ
ncbi:glycoside hydrolase family protein [Escherichia coli]|nr:glycoside hydrolase family protein [Escherichia coli]